MPINQKELEGLIPDLRGLVDPRAEPKIYMAFRRIYEYFSKQLDDQRKEFEAKIKIQELKQENFSALIGVFATPLIGSGVSDPFLQSIMEGFGPQNADEFFAGPNPSFRVIVLSDLPTIALSKLDTKVLKTDDNLNKDITGAPLISDGFIIIKDNNGNSKKVLTTA